MQSLGWENPLEKEMATHFSVLAWTVPWTEEPGMLQSMGLQRVGHNLVTKQQQSLTTEICSTDQHAAAVLPGNFPEVQTLTLGPLNQILINMLCR